MGKEPLKQCNTVSAKISLCSFIPSPTGRIFQLVAWWSVFLFYYESEIPVFAAKTFSQTENYAWKLFKYSYPVIKFIRKWFSFKKADTLSKILKMNKGNEICTGYFWLLTFFFENGSLYILKKISTKVSSPSRRIMLFLRHSNLSSS